MSTSAEMVRSARRHLSSPTAVPRSGKAVVACMDTRVDPLRILNASVGDLHIIRNAGGIVTDDVLRSLLLSQAVLNTDQVLVMMHTNCGLEGLDETSVLANAPIKPGFALGSFDDLEQRLTQSVELVRATDLLPHRDRVTGAVFDVVSGRLKQVLI